jgi:hypothetical protein
MANVEINHAFVSAKPNSADGTIVSSNAWNADLIVGGGANGNMPARNSASATGATWVDGPRISTNSGSYSGASPSGALAPIVLTHNSNTNILFIGNVTAITSGGAACQVVIARSGVTIDVFNAGGDGVSSSWGVGYVESPGTYTYSISVATLSGTFTSLNVRLTIVSTGVV